MKKLTFIISLLVVLSGCIKDETNRDYLTLTFPYIDNPDKLPELFVENTVYELEYGYKLVIDPAVVYPDMDDLSYEWKIDGKTVCTQKELEWECDLSEERNRVSGALYITRNSAGNATVFRFTVLLRIPYDRGWAIISEKDGKIVYDFLHEKVAKQYEYTEYPDALNTGSTPESWLKTMQYWSNELGSTAKSRLFHLDNDPLKSFNVEGNSMSPLLNLDQDFVGESIPSGVRFKDAVYSGYLSLLLGEDGRLYFRKSYRGFDTGKFSSLPLKYGGKDLIVSTIVDTYYYDTGFVIVYDSDNNRFLMIRNAYNDMDNHDAGVIAELPVGSAFGDFSSEEILHAHLLSPSTYDDVTNQLFIVSKNTTTSEVTVSQYSIDNNGGIVTAVRQDFYRVAVPHLGENSKIVVIDNFKFMMPGMGETKSVYFTDSDDARNLYVSDRGTSGMSEPKLYNTFDSRIVAMNQSAINRTFKTLGVGFENNEFKVLNVLSSKNSYVPPTEEKLNSLSYTWSGLDGRILDIQYKYTAMPK